MEAKAQELKPIETDRPDQTETPYLVPVGYLQFENGLSYEHSEGEAYYSTLPVTLWRYGINNNFELRMAAELSHYILDDSTLTGIPPVELGFKARLVDEQGWIPQISFIGHLSAPNASTDNLRTKYMAPSFRFTMQNNLSERVALGYNLGAEWDGENPGGALLYTLSSGVSLTDNLGFYLEIYGFTPEKRKPDHRLNGGFTYLLNDNIKADITAGYGISKISPGYYLAAGISFRTSLLKK